MKRIILLGLVFTSIHIYAQDFNKTKLDSLFSLIENNNKGMGSFSIFHDGKEVYQRAFGNASIADNLKANITTKYRIGSISKTFTAVIILQLVNEGKLELTTTLSKFYPEIKQAEKITILNLLKHRSGIFNFTSSADYQSWMEQPISKENLIAKIAGYPSGFEPGKKYEYSNSNYVLLSFIVEDILHKTFSEVIQSRICAPCSLRNTYYGGKIAVKRNEALSYTWQNDWQLATETDMSVPMGAGAIVSTPTDLNKFLTCLFTSNIVTGESLKEMMDIEDGYGIGMFRIPFYDKQAYGHTGGIDGFRSNAFYFPVEKVSIAFTANGVVMPLNDILIGALSIYFGRDYELPEFTEGLNLKPEELEKYLGIYSSTSFPLKITISKQGNNLFAQATGQPSFPLEAYDVDKFRYLQAKLEMEFIPADGKMIFRQAGAVFELVREK